MDRADGAAAWLQAVGQMIFLRDEPQRSDVIFLPGSPDPEPAIYAAELYRRGMAPLIVPSGRWAVGLNGFAFARPEVAAFWTNSYATESVFLRDVLIQNGVPGSAILCEDQASFTWDNAVRSRLLLDSAGIRPSEAIVCCKPWHARRAWTYYQLAFPEARLLCCPCPWPGRSPDDWFLTPDGRKTVLQEFARCGGQLGGECLKSIDGALDLTCPPEPSRPSQPFQPSKEV